VFTVQTLAFRPHLGLLVGGLLAIHAALLAVPAAAAVPNPIVTGPIPQTVAPGDPSHNYIFFSSNHDLAGHGYVEEEFFIQGTANRYNTPNQTNPGPASTGTIISSGNPYKTRMVVRRPADPSKFNGVVLVEWYNVTNNFDAENTWFFSWEHIMRSGYVWVGVSAQRVGVNALKAWSSRYSTLDVTLGNTLNDDSLSYDIFSQAGQALDAPVGVDPLHGLLPIQIIAMGESQSAMRLAIYANSIQPLANFYDAILLLSSLGNRVRQDLSIPVFKVLTEFDVTSSEANVRQTDTSLFRTWEVAGTSHVDQHLRDSREPLELRDNRVSTEATGLDGICGFQPVGTRVPTTYVMASAYDKLVQWVQNGTPPPTAPRIQIATFGNPSIPVRNGLGLAQGGIQLSQVVVPTRINNGTNTGPGACARWGYSIPIDPTVLHTLYPSHDVYFNMVIRASKVNAINGYILMPDLVQDMIDALISNVGN
jgi:Alpha/beta hydrolase domain